MWIGNVNTDANGIVLFDPGLIVKWRPNLVEGAGLFTELTTTDVGDEVLARGLLVPILAIDDAGYTIIVRTTGESSPVVGEIVVQNGEFPLHIEGELVVADLALLRDWCPGWWTHVPIPPGEYAATIRGFRRMGSDGTLTSAGYEVILDRRSKLPHLTGVTGRNMRVINWWDDSNG
jgi:hypothetical protein